MSYKTIIFGLLTVVANGWAQSCCDTEESKGEFWSWNKASSAKEGDNCALSIRMFDGLKLNTALDYIGCKDFNTLIIDGRHMTEPFVASELDMDAIPEHTNVIYENIQSAQIEKEETGNNLKTLNLVGSEDFKFHPSLLDEAEYIEFDGVKLQYNSDERLFKLTQSEHRSAPRVEALIQPNGTTLGTYTPTNVEMLLMLICGVQLIVIIMILVVSIVSKTNATKESSLSRIGTASSFGSEYSGYSSAASQYSGPSRKISTSSSDIESQQSAEVPNECTIMIEETQKS